MRRSLVASVSCAVEHRASLSPVIRQSASTARRIEASARHELSQGSCAVARGAAPPATGAFPGERGGGEDSTLGPLGSAEGLAGWAGAVAAVSALLSGAGVTPLSASAAAWICASASSIVDGVVVVGVGVSSRSGSLFGACAGALPPQASSKPPTEPRQRARASERMGLPFNGLTAPTLHAAPTASARNPVARPRSILSNGAGGDGTTMAARR